MGFITLGFSHRGYLDFFLVDNKENPQKLIRFYVSLDSLDKFDEIDKLNLQRMDDKWYYSIWP